MNGKKLRDIRNYIGQSQREFATLLGVGPAYLSQMENGHKPISDRVRMQLAKHVQITPELTEAVKRYEFFLDDNKK